jgi:hypothetical protein
VKKLALRDPNCSSQTPFADPAGPSVPEGCFAEKLLLIGNFRG